MIKIGVLCLQGAFYEHEKILDSLGICTAELRKKSDLNKSIDGLIIPGGESTVMAKLLVDLNMYSGVKGLIEDGLPTYGSCAGLILLAKKITNDNRNGLATMDIAAERNAYGRQLGSFAATTSFKGVGDFNAVFIRAPYITDVWGGTQILATVNNRIVAARERNQLVTAFHPELTNDTRIHEYFINMVTHPV